MGPPFYWPLPPPAPPSTTTSTSTYTFTGNSWDGVVFVVILLGGLTYVMVVAVSLLNYFKEKPDTAEANKAGRFPHTKFLWDIIKTFLWPLRLLWWLVVEVALAEWCIPACQWFRDNKPGWCTCVGVRAWACDMCCFSNCRDAFHVFFRGRGGYRGIVELENQTGVVGDQPLTADWAMEGLPSYSEANR